jgi:membrane protease subunit (stomatin/prohibitin family)
MMRAENSSEPFRVIEWTEDVAGVLLWRTPLQKIGYGTRLSVRESQLAIFTCDGLIADKFSPGLYTLTKDSLRVLSVFNSWTNRDRGQLKTEVCFVKTKYFIDLPLHLSVPVVANSRLSLSLDLSGKFDLKTTNAANLVRGSGSATCVNTSDVRKNISAMISNMAPRIIIQNRLDVESPPGIAYLTDLIEESVNINLDRAGLLIRNLNFTEACVQRFQPA